MLKINKTCLFVFAFSVSIITLLSFLLNFSSTKPKNSNSLTISSQVFPVDPQYSNQKDALNNIQIESAWDITTGSREIIVAVIDDAIDIHHPDLRDNMMPGYDFLDGDNDPSPGKCVDSVTQIEALEQHGTQIAGVIGATGNNNLGISGINWQIKIMPLRIGCAYPRNLEFLAVQYAIEHGANIINASYGGPAALATNTKVLALLKTVEQDVLFVTSAGNYQGNNDDSPVYPGNSPLLNVITVAASDTNNQLSEWTQYGAASVDLSAPGVGIQTTIAGDNVFGDYSEVNGSSFSTAVVSGVAALIKSQDFNKNLSAPDLKAILQASVSSVDGHISKTKTAGVVNAKIALELLSFPQPVVSISAINYDDSGSIYENNLIDENEIGEITVQLENLWREVLSGEINVSVDNEIVQLSTTVFNLSAMQVGENIEITIPIQTNSFSGHQRINFLLNIQVTGTSQNVQYKRSFEIQTGPLNNNKIVNYRIQQNNFDDYQYYHLNIPPNMDRASIELTYSTSDTRDMGLLSSFNQRPEIQFRPFAGNPYWYQSDYRVDGNSGFESLSVQFPAAARSTLNVMVFNASPVNPFDNFEKNKNYSLKACFYSDNDGNQAPFVDVGDNRVVNAGDSVILSATVSDIDGIITRSYWMTNSDVAFTVLENHQIQFIAPAAGEYSFTFVAIDDGCKRTVDNVRINIKEITGNEPQGLILSPPDIFIEENSGIDVFVSGFYNAKAVTNLVLVKAPDGATYLNGKLTWRDISPTGIYFVKFTASVDSQLLEGTITVNVEKRSEGGGGGGCVLMKTDKFDPTLLIYVFLSGFFIHKRSKKQNN